MVFRSLPMTKQDMTIVVTDVVGNGGYKKQTFCRTTQVQSRWRTSFFDQNFVGTGGVHKAEVRGNRGVCRVEDVGVGGRKVLRGQE